MEPLLAPLAATERTRVRRLPRRASYERQTIRDILDAAYVCHVGFAVEGQPFVLPTAFARIDDAFYVHAAAVSRMARTLAAGAPICATVSHLDGLVLARSAFHHSMNYRSVVILGVAAEVAEAAEKIAALEALVEKVQPGRWRQVRPPSRKELDATTVLRLSIDEASAKIRTGPPVDDADDYALPCWAGVIPLSLARGEPVPDVAPPPAPRHDEA